MKSSLSYYRFRLRTAFAKNKPVILGLCLFLLIPFFLPEAGEIKLTATEDRPGEKEFSAAVALYYQGELEDSLVEFRRLADKYPSCGQTVLHLARLLREKGEFDEALEHLASLVNRNPSQVDYRLALTITAYLAGRAELALESSSLLPETAETLFWRGLILKELGRENAAAENLVKALDLEPYNPMAHYFLGQLYFNRGDYQKAQNFYQQALRQEPNMTAAFYPLAASYLQLAEYGPAYNLLQRAEASLPWHQSIKEEREKLEANHPYLVEERRLEQKRRQETIIPPQVEPAGDRETIPEVRIGLAEKIREVHIKTGAPFSLSAKDGRKINGPSQMVLFFRQVSGGIEVRKCDDGSLLFRAGGLLVLSYEDPGATTAVFNLEFGQGYFWAGQEDRMYRGQLEFLARPDGLTIVNLLNTEEYLYSVVPAEMPSSWPAAALETQAIAARTYTVANMGRYGTRGFDLLASVLSAAYPGIRSETPSTRAAVDATRGMILTAGNRPITAVYSANSAGFTESSREVWSFDHAYLQAIPDENLPPQITEFMAPEDLAGWLSGRPLTYSSHPDYSSRAAYRWRLWISRGELEALLALGDRLGQIISLTTAGRGPSGRVKEVRIKGTAGEYIVRGDLIRSRLGGLRSSLFVVEPKMGPDGLPEFFIFTGGGWGHGVGMCQSGAAGMAAAGRSYREILAHYYPGAVLSKRY